MRNSFIGGAPIASRFHPGDSVAVDPNNDKRTSSYGRQGGTGIVSGIPSTGRVLVTYEDGILVDVPDRAVRHWKKNPSKARAPIVWPSGLSRGVLWYQVVRKNYLTRYEDPGTGEISGGSFRSYQHLNDYARRNGYRVMAVPHSNPRKRNPRKFAVGDLVSHVNGHPQGHGTVTHVAEYAGRRDQSVTVKWPPQEFQETYSSKALTLVKKNPGGKRKNPLSPYAKYHRAQDRKMGIKPPPKPKFKIGDWVSDLDGARPGEVVWVGNYVPGWEPYVSDRGIPMEGSPGYYNYTVQQVGGPRQGRNERNLMKIRKPRKKNPLTSGLGDTYATMHANPRSLPVKATAFPSIRHASGWHTYRLVQRLSGGRGTDKSAIFFAPDNTAARNHASKVLFDGARAIRLERAV